MKTRDYKVMRAILLLGRISADVKLTVGEVSRWTGIPKSSVRRSLDKLVRLGCVDFVEYTSKKKACRDFFLTPNVGLPIAQSIRELL